jgi:hypothetical protein
VSDPPELRGITAALPLAAVGSSPEQTNKALRTSVFKTESTGVTRGGRRTCPGTKHGHGVTRAACPPWPAIGTSPAHAKCHPRGHESTIWEHGKE